MKFIARFSLVLIILVAALSALAVDQEPKMPQTTPNSGVNEAKGTSTPQDPAKAQDLLSPTPPMMNEIQAVMDVSRGEIAELVANAAGTHDFTAKQAIQIAIGDLKKQTELDIMGIQARYARSSGNEELALQIDAAIASITSPPSPTAPAEARPAPGNQN